MKTTITAKLLHTITKGPGEQRFYELSAPIENFTNGLTTVKNELEYTRRFLGGDLKNLIPQGISGWDIICVSDAHTHLERLVFFWGAKLKKVNTLVLTLYSLMEATR